MSQIIFESMLDNKYNVKVVRKDSYNGILQVWHKTDLLMERDVTLSYGAKFGPDVADVNEWQTIATEFIDGRS